MKKIIHLLALICLSSSAISQDTTSLYKPLPGDWNVEVNFSPLSSNPIFINNIRLRKFKSSSKANRFGIMIGYYSQNPSSDITNSYFEMNFRPGSEKHFKGSDRLSPYIGWEIDLGFKTSKSTNDTGANRTTINGAWDENGSVERGFIRFGANFIIGADYYVAKRVYLGTEIAFGFQYQKFSDVKEVRNAQAFQEPLKGGSTFQLGPNYNSAIRLGFLF